MEQSSDEVDQSGDESHTVTFRSGFVRSIE